MYYWYLSILFSPTTHRHMDESTEEYYAYMFLSNVTDLLLALSMHRSVFTGDGFLVVFAESL